MENDPQPFAHVSWTRQNIINAVVILLLVGMVIYGVTLTRRVSRQDQEAKVKQVVIEHMQTINADSLRTVIESHVQDSIRSVRVIFETRLKQIQDENRKYRSQNKALRASFDSVYINRPDF